MSNHQNQNEWFEFFVNGKPATAGSKRAIPVRRKDGSTVTIVTDDNQRSKPWMQEVAHTAHSVWCDDLLEGAVDLQFYFCRRRPASHFSKRDGTLLHSAPQTWDTRPDGLKLARCAEDALTGVIWRDDAQVHSHVIAKVWAQLDGLLVRVRPSSQTFVLDRRILEVMTSQAERAAQVDEIRKQHTF